MNIYVSILRKEFTPGTIMKEEISLNVNGTIYFAPSVYGCFL